MNDNKDKSKGEANTAKTGKPASSGPGPDDAPHHPEAKGKQEDGKPQTSASKKGGRKGGDPAREGQSNNAPGKNRESSSSPKHKRPAKKKSSANRQAANSPRTGARSGGQTKPTLRQPPVDRGELESKAWALYCADINEEGTAMFNEEEAEELVRRSFILSDIFLRFRDQLYGTGSAQGNHSPTGDSGPPQ